MKPELFGTMPDGEPVYRVRLQSAALRVHVLTFGAVIQSIEAPDRQGARANVVLGLSALADYVAHSPHFGAVPGRYAGRIAKGRFELDGVAYQLACNNGPNAIHGGPHGFGKRAWTLEDFGPQHVVLHLSSADGDAGYPGRVETEVRYTLEDTVLRIDFAASTSRATVLNLTNHSYFNLAGEGSGDVLGHRLTIDADAYAPIDADLIPTGAIGPVAGTPFDFRTERAIGARIAEPDPQLRFAGGYDHGYVLPGEGLRRAAMLCDPGSGRTLGVFTTQTSLQLYTGNTLTGLLTGPSGRVYRKHNGVCLEAQHLPDSPNKPGFPSTILRPGQAFSATTLFRFGVLE